MLIAMTQLPTPPDRPPSRPPWGPHDGQARSQRGLAVRQARDRRTRSLRRVVISGALALFVAAWLLIAIVLVSGHDPALAARASTTATPATSTISSSATSTAASTTPAPSAGTPAASASVGSVSTRQS